VSDAIDQICTNIAVIQRVDRNQILSATPMSCKVKWTYKSRQSKNSTSSAQSIAQNRKRSFEEHSPLSLTTNLPLSKRAKMSDKGNPSLGGDKKTRNHTQLHFCIDQAIVRTCSECGLTYTKGAPDDEVLHRAHCVRVQKGMEWGREEEKETLKYGVTEVHRGIKLKDRRTGRIICLRADIGGKIGSKVC
jgi:N-acetyltransferase